jgi:hypothetical protein
MPKPKPDEPAAVTPERIERARAHLRAKVAEAETACTRALLGDPASQGKLGRLRRSLARLDEPGEMGLAFLLEVEASIAPAA